MVSAMKTLDPKTEQSAVLLTKKEKLMRWAAQVRSHPTDLIIFHDLEHWSKHDLAYQLGQHGPSAFGIAANDPVFRAAGIKGSSAQDALDFFELSQGDLHEFSCDCGGAINNHQMADRINRLAGERSPTGKIPSGYTYFPRNLFGRTGAW